MKIFIACIFLLCPYVITSAQHVVTGSVISENTKEAIAHATITLKKSNITVFTDAKGYFSIRSPILPDTITIAMVGFHSKSMRIDQATTQEVNVALSAIEMYIEEVHVSTGYYSVPRERATGSFSFIDNELLNRSVSTDIISRLEGVTNGLQFERTGTTLENRQPAKLRVRGISSIHSDTNPLIVVDNFPYEGNIQDINPNDVEHITILKDAAAASIWGARAANGVIVITTKTARYEQPIKVSTQSNMNILQRPDLVYNPGFIPSGPWMEVEKFLFEQGFYGEGDDFAALPPYVELLIQQRDAQISDADFQRQKDEFQNSDIRNDASNHLYRNAIHQQYAMNVSGGSQRYKYYLSGGYDRDLDNIIGNEYNRINVSVHNSVRLHPKIELNLGAYYTANAHENNGVSLQDVQSIAPYTRLKDEQGNHLATVRNYRIPYIESAQSNGLLDWQYRPLDERGLSDRTRIDSRIRFDSHMKLNLTPALTAELRYQYQGGNGQNLTLNGKDSYYVRNLVNQYTQSGGTRIIPHGDILRGNNSKQIAHYGRIQINYNNTFSEQHQISALLGGEIRDDRTISGHGYLLYGYDDQVLTYTNLFDYTKFYPTNPQGSRRIPANSTPLVHLTDRNMSYFGNASYNYLSRYTVSVSSRWDGSNLFGVKTNQKGVPLWSAGVSWNISNEDFWLKQIVPYLRLRTTYGVNGNVNRYVSALPTVSIATHSITQYPVATLRNPGNPSLRWEQVKTFNAALDFRLSNNWLEGSVDYFVKNANDLIGERYLDPTTGLSGSSMRNLVNYAAMQTTGWDVQLSSTNLSGSFTWKTDVLFNWVKNKVTRYEFEDSFSYSGHVVSNRIPIEGKSKDVQYALPWAGLDGQTGAALVLVNGEKNMDYTGFLNSLRYDDLIISGLTVPPYYGSIRNTFQWKNLLLSMNITWKAGYVFKRNSINYSQMFSQAVMHADYLSRWQNPGDERHTNIPAMPADVNHNRDYVFTHSEYLIESGNHIRLQDLRFSYMLNNPSILTKTPVKDIRFSLYANNMGMIWQKSKSGLDPDFPNANYPNARSYAFGIQVNF